MKGWLVRRDGSIRGWIGFVYDTHAAAMADCPRGCEIVEIELPDPPHEWKVGDWFRLYRKPMRITDMTDRVITWTGRNDMDEPRADWCPLTTLDAATPCDPPAWFTEDGAS